MKKTAAATAIEVFCVSRLIEAEILHIPLQLSEAFEGRTLSWPVTMGVPLPEGKLKPGFGWRLADAQGREAACQVKPVGWWRRTASVQWVTVRFVAVPGRSYTLELGEGLKPAEPKHPIRVAEEGEALTVTSRHLRAQFARTGPCALAQLKVDGRRLLKAQGRPANYFLDQHGRRHAAEGESEGREIVVEDRGPFHAAVRCSGSYVGPDGRKAARYRTRYHFVAGVPFVKIQHAFLVLTDTQNLQFRDLAYALPITLSTEARAVSFDSSGLFAGQVVAKEWDSGTRLLSMAQETFRHYGQDESRFRVYETSRDGERVQFSGDQGGQYADVSTPDGGLTVGLRWLWQQFPKEIEIARDAAVVHLWSPRGGLLDFRVKGCTEFWGEELFEFWKEADQRKRVAKFAANSEGYDNAKGLEKSHEMWIWPRSESVPAEQIAEFGRLIEQPVLAIAEPAWNCASGVFGPISPRNPSAAPEAEGLLKKMLSRRREAADAFGDYGWWAFGQNDHAAYVSHKFREDAPAKLLATPYRFTHATYGHLRSMWALYYRSGDREIYEYLLPRLYCLLDIRVKHVDDERWQRGCWAGYPSMPIPWWSHDTYFFNTIDFSLKEALWAYYATGDERWREWADTWVAASRKFTDKAGWPKWYVDETYSGYTASWARGVHFFLNSLTCAYAHCGDDVL